MPSILLHSPFQLMASMSWPRMGVHGCAVERCLLPRSVVKIEAHIEHGTLARLLTELAPVRIHMTPPEEGSRWIELDEPSLVQAVPGRGLRIHASGRLRMDVWRVPLRLGIRRIRMLLEPVVVEREGKPRLAFAIELEEGDLVGVPRFVERPLVRRINALLQPRNTKLVWSFADTLTHRFDIPRRLEPVDALSLAATGGQVDVDDQAVHFSVELTPALHRAELSEPEEPDAPATTETLDPRLLLGVAGAP